MCKKLIFILAMVMMTVPALAVDYISHTNPLQVDIDGQEVTAKSGWQSWLFATDWDSPQSKSFSVGGGPPDYPVVELAVRRQDAGTQGGARNRSGGLAFVGRTSELGQGLDHLKLTITNLTPSKEYQIQLWSMEDETVWSSPDTAKSAVWLAHTNPTTWLAGNGYADGYDPVDGIPAGLAALVASDGGMASVKAPDGADYLGNSQSRTTFNASADGSGNIAIYGWLDVADWTGSFHIPINGFRITPEPATIALLGLGGLALLRRKKGRRE